MASLLPDNAPTGPDELVERIYAAPSVDIDTLRLMALLEGTGQGLYLDLANACRSPAASALFLKSAREERGHAYRMIKAIRMLGGASYQMPSLAENTYYVPNRFPEPSPEVLLALSASERRGADLYSRWALQTEVAAVAQLFRLTAREELGHAARLEEAARLADEPARAGTPVATEPE